MARNLKALLTPINGNDPSPELINLLLDKVVSIPNIATPNANYDLFSVMKKKAGSWGDDPVTRQAWMVVGLSCSASLESSYSWTEGRDLSANNTSLDTQEAGIFQCSANFVKHGADLKKLFTDHTGIPYGENSAMYRAFITQTKTDHEFATEFMMRLCRIRVDTHGPILRGTINDYIKQAAVDEAYALIKKAPDVIVDPPVIIAGLPPKPTTYDEMFRLYGNPQEKNWERDNIDFCAVDSSLTAFPYISSRGSRGFYCNKRIIGQFQKVFAEVVQKKLQSAIYTFDGCWVVRYVRGSSTKLSNHSWGLALDLDYEGNELGDTTPSIDMRLVQIFKNNGFFWGGDYKGRKDPGHVDWSTGV